MSTFGFRMQDPAPRHRPLWQPLLGIVVVLGLIGVGLLRLLAGPADFPAGTAGSRTRVTVNAGDTLRTIGSTLAADGVVASVDAFVQATDANPQSRSIAPGDYLLPTHIPANTAITLLLDPASRDDLRIVIPEGVRAVRVYAIVAAALGVPASDVRAAFEATPLPPSATGGPEGYLFPATYEVKRGTTPAQVAAMMVARFQQAAADLELERRARAEHLSVHDVLVIASLLEQESAPADFAKVARVVLNRLARTMPLQLDSTVNYGLGTSDLNLSQGQLNQDTPFNTYLHPGLPPTPIDNPGSAAIEAALSPAIGDWLYFVTTDPVHKVTEFASTYQQFLALKAKYLAGH